MNKFNRMNSIKVLLTLVAVFTIIVGALPALAQSGDGPETSNIKPASLPQAENSTCPLSEASARCPEIWLLISHRK